MGIDGYGSCGSAGGVKIMLQYKDSETCTIQTSNGFYAGGTINWTKNMLGDCKDVRFDPTKPQIHLWILSDKYDRFCPISVEISLENERYMLSLPDGDWHNKDERDDIKYKAILVED